MIEPLNYMIRSFFQMNNRSNLRISALTKVVAFIAIFLWVSHSSAQYNEQAPWMVAKGQEKQVKSKNQELTLDEISLRFNTYWQGKDFKAKGSGFKPFKRWEDYWRHATDQNGYLPSSVELWKA